jgi:hypothetical protein
VYESSSNVFKITGKGKQGVVGASKGKQGEEGEWTD